MGGNDGSGHTLDEEQINTICAASEFPVVVGGGVHADDMEMLARSKAAGWFVVSAIAGADDPEAATREMVTRWKAVRGDKKHGYAPRVEAAVEEAEKPAETGEKKFTNAKEAKAASKLAKQQRVDIAARDSKQRDKAHIRKTTLVHFENQFGTYDLEVPYTEIKLSDTPRCRTKRAVQGLQHGRPEMRSEGGSGSVASRLDSRPWRCRGIRRPSPQS